MGISFTRLVRSKERKGTASSQTQTMTQALRIKAAGPGREISKKKERVLLSTQNGAAEP